MSIFSRIADALIARAKRTPYSHIINGVGLTQNPNEADYMCRWHLIKPGRFPFAARVHHIKMADQDRHLHTHPWNAVSLILKGGYWEERPSENGGITIWRGPGSLVRLSHKDVHRIVKVADGGAWTLFMTGKYRHTWGFLIPYREYLGDN
jgi:hypothetical protein